MSLGTVQINRLNLMQGELDEIERHFLFIGTGTTNTGNLLAVGLKQTLTKPWGLMESVLKTQVEAARQNAGQNWSAGVIPVVDGTDWEDAVDFAMEKTKCEAIVLTEPATAGTDLEAMYTKSAEIMAEYMRPVFFMAAARALDTDTETWDAYVTAIKPITDNVAADRVCVVPYLWGHDLGALAGRLCNRAVTVADTPMRVAIRSPGGRMVCPAGGYERCRHHHGPPQGDGRKPLFRAPVVSGL